MKLVLTASCGLMLEMTVASGYVRESVQGSTIGTDFYPGSHPRFLFNFGIRVQSDPRFQFSGRRARTALPARHISDSRICLSSVSSLFL